MAWPAAAAPVNEPLAFTLDDMQIHQPVDKLTWCMDCALTDWTTQEPWVVNPTTCMWDTDDEFSYRGAGTLEAGASVSVSACGLMSGQELAASTRLLSPSPDLMVTYRVGAEVVTATPTWDPAARAWRYDVCFRPGPIQGTPVEIPDSYGGSAIPFDITVTMANPTDRKVRNTGGRISFGWIPYFRDC